MDFSTEKLTKIALDAREAAEKALAREVPFHGSMPAAETYGYPMYSLEAKLFSPVYLYVINQGVGPDGIQLDENGYICVPV